MRWKLLLVLGLVVTLVIPAFPVTLAQEATPAASPVATGELLDLAAMALTEEELPPGYAADLARYTPPELIPSTGPFSPEDVAATGIRNFYIVFFVPRESAEQDVIRVYIGEYPTPEAVEAGFAVFEDETVAPDDPFAPLSFEDLPGLEGLGEDPSEVSVTVYERGPGLLGQDVDATFRVGNLLAGVGIEGPLEVAAGTPSPEPDPERLRRVTELAGTLHARIESVLAGSAPSGTNLELPSSLAAAPADWISIEEGYVSPAQALPGVAEEARTGVAFSSGYFRTMATTSLQPRGSGLPPDWWQGLPHVRIGVAEFGSPEDASAALARAREGVIPFALAGPKQPAAAPAVAGADETVAYQTAYFPLPGLQPDGFGVALTVDDRLAVVEVVGTPTAEAIALDVAAQQAACLVNGACNPLVVDQAPAMAGTPAASPVGGEAVLQTLVAGTVEVPDTGHYVDLVRVDYAPGAAEELIPTTGPVLVVVAAGSIAAQVDGPAWMMRAGSPELAEEIAGEEVHLDVGDGVVLPAGTAFAFHNAGEAPGVLVGASFIPFDAPVVPRTEGVSFHWFASGPPAVAGPNEVALNRVTLPPGAMIEPPLLYAVASGNPELNPDGGLVNGGTTNVELVTLSYTPAPMPEQPPDAAAMPGTPSATPEP